MTATTRKPTRALFLALCAAAWLGLAPAMSSADVVCRRARISGFDDCYNRAKPLVGANTSDITKMKVYVTAAKGHLYAQSNYQTPGYDFPTKIAVSKGINVLDLVHNLVNTAERTVVPVERLEKATREDVTFIGDKDALDRAGLSFDFRGARRVYSVDGALLTPREGGEREARPPATPPPAPTPSVEEVARRAAARRAAEREKAFRATVREEADADQDVGSFRRGRKAELSKLSNREMHLFSVTGHAGGMEVHSEVGSLFLFPDEVEQLSKGKPLDRDHPLTKLLESQGGGAFVLYSKERPGEGPGDFGPADKLAFALQRAYPEKRIYRDPFSTRTPGLTRRLNKFCVKAPRDLVTLIAGDSFEVTDWKIIQNIAPDLKKKGFEDVRTLEKGRAPEWKGGGGKAVIVITGHIDDKLAGFIDELGRAGYFKDNLVLLNTCREVPTRALASRISSEHGAVGVFCYDSKIEAANVEDFVLGLADAVAANPDKPLVDLLNKTIGTHRLNGIWTLCADFRRLMRDYLCGAPAGAACPGLKPPDGRRPRAGGPS